MIGSKTHVALHPLVEPKNKLPAEKWRAHSTFYFTAERLPGLLVYFFRSDFLKSVLDTTE